MAENTSKTYDWKNLVEEVEGEDFKKRPIAYEFNGGKKVFRMDENSTGSVYHVEPTP